MRTLGSIFAVKYFLPLLLLLFSSLVLFACEFDESNDGDYDTEDSENTEVDGDQTTDGDDDQIVDGDDDQTIDGDGDQATDGDGDQTIDGDDESTDGDDESTDGDEESTDGDVDGDQEVCEGCLIEGKCVEDGEESEDFACAVCDAENNAEGWSPKATTVECRAAEGECDVSEMCDGETLACPEDGFVAADTTCGDAATECSAQDTCDGTGVCQPNHLGNTVTCGDAGTECVNQDYCDGAGACTDNGFVAADATCGDAATECSAQDTCDGAGVCQPNHLANTVTCGDAGAECVNQDYCDGAGACTDNGFVAADTTCGDTATECSGQDTCDGAGVCQPNHLANTETCGDAGTECVNQDYCDGAGTCADNGFKNNGTSCGDADQCLSGACVDCFDASGCTDLAWDGRDSVCSARVCSASNTCEFRDDADGTSCSLGKGVIVDEDQCVSGACVDCYDGNGCTDLAWGSRDSNCSARVCNSSHTCEFSDQTDGTVCNETNQCVTGGCVDCYDNTGCTDLAWSGRDSVCSARVCNASNACEFSDDANGTACSLSKGVITDSDQCVDGVCLDCFDTDGCNDYSADGNPCTSVACVGNSCTDVNDNNNTCDLGIACTDDVCQDGNCVFSQVTSGCYINNKCVTEGTSGDDDGCTACSPNDNKLNWTNMNGVACAQTDDGNPCTDDVCSDGICVGQNDDTNECTDSLDCTTESCVSGSCDVSAISGCAIENACYADNALKALTGNDSCQACIAGTKQEEWTTLADTSNCDDGNACTYNDKCASGVCVGTELGLCVNGSCDPASGDCNCDLGWAGAECDVCALGWAGASCDTCDLHWTGDECDQCETGYAGETCSSCDTNYQDNDGDGVCTIACTHADAHCRTSLSCDDSSGEIACSCSGAFVNDFVEDFEDNNYDGWITNGSTMTMVASDLADSSYALEITDSGGEHWDGVETDVLIDSPANMSYYFKFTGSTIYSSYMNMYNSAGELIFRIQTYTTGNFTTVGKENLYYETETILSADTWYFVEVEFDWENYTADVYLDGVLQVDDMLLGFTTTSNTTDVQKIEFYNYYSPSTLTIDEIKFNTCQEISNKVATGLYSTCGVTSAGAAKCWGNNWDGHLGNNSTTLSLVPIDVNGLGSGVNTIFSNSIDNGSSSYYTCAVLDSGSAKCWGSNQYGQLGNNDTSDSYVPVDVSGLSSGVVAMELGDFHACALLDTGAVQCWGYNGNGRLGNNDNVNSLVPVDVTGLSSGVEKISVGYSHACALLDTGAVKCWGSNWRGSLGNNSMSDGLVPVDVMGLDSGVVDISAGYHSTCAVLNTGGIKCWGDNQHGQLGNNSTTYSLFPVDVTGLGSSAKAVSSRGYGHACALLNTGAVQCWGHNGHGQLGDNSSTNSLVPVDVNNLSSGVIDIATSYMHSCAYMADATIKCWGYNPFGGLGNNSTTESWVPVDVIGF